LAAESWRKSLPVNQGGTNKSNWQDPNREEPCIDSANQRNETQPMIAKYPLWITLLVAWCSTPAQAVPRFAVQNGADCILCHVNPTGGAVRNEFGRDVFARRRLSLERDKQDTKRAYDAFLGKINDTFTVGGDLRLAYLRQSDSEADADEDPDLDSLFLMQADLYSSQKLSKNLTLVEDLGLRSALEIAAIQSLPKGFYVKGGAFTPPFGWKFPNHTEVNRIDLGFDPAVVDTGVEVGRAGNKVGFNLMFSNGELAKGANFNNNLFNGKFAVSGRAQYTKRSDLMNITLALSGAYDRDQGQTRTRLVSQNVLRTDSENAAQNIFSAANIDKIREAKIGGSLGVSMGRLWYLGELDAVQNYILPNAAGTTFLQQTNATKVLSPTGYLSYQEVGMSIVQGLDVYAAFEYHDPDATLKADPVNPAATDPILRYGLFVELFLSDNIELLLFHRVNSAGLAGLAKDSSDSILMLHLFY
jgi:hypothetical protein